MGKKLESTPRSRIRQVLRQAWLRSRERAAALKRDNYTCQYLGCGKKQSKAKGKEVKVQVHHIDGMDWEKLIDLVFESGLFCKPENLITLCEDCHKKIKSVANGTKL
jgi:5-methylcytosine-specific restriction endonuclease McrA